MSGRKALIIGIDEYPTQPLRSATNDAEEVASMLTMAEYAFDVTLLLNKDATRRTLLQQLDAVFSNQPEFVIIYFAGHGATTKMGTYLVSVDFDQIDPGIELDYLRKLIQANSEDDTTVVVILDCCHSGAAAPRSLSGSNLASMRNSDVERSLAMAGNGKVVLAACQPHESSYEEPSLHHGVFTYFLLEGLYGDAADSEGKLTIPNLYDHVSKRFEEITHQTPVFKGDIVGRIILGDGLRPRDRSELPGKQVTAIEAKAHELMNEYVKGTAMEIESWKTFGYRDACSTLAPNLRWLEKQIEKHPKLKSRPSFVSAYDTARSKLADLGHLLVDMNTKIGTVRAKLGSGTFGTVWHLLAEDGHDLAYKVYHPLDLDNTEKIGRFVRGFHAMEQLDHPNIVKVHQFTECPVGFVMDFIQGPNLRDYVPTRPESEEIIFQLLTVAETLKHAHSRKVVHRDVKPENIIMRWDADTQKYRPYLTDFDLAWFSAATQFTREGIGSLIYAAPEQLVKANASIAHEPTTDVYAFGQLCFFLICRRDPVPGLADNARALAEELRSWSLEEPAHKMVQLYELCSHQQPYNRIQDFRIICDQLFEIKELLSESDHTRPMSLEAFSRQLVFSAVGAARRRIVERFSASAS